MAGPVGFLSGSERHFTCSAHLDRFISSRVQLTGIAIGDRLPISAPEAMMASAYQWSRGAGGWSGRASLQRLDKLATLLDVSFHVPGPASDSVLKQFFAWCRALAMSRPRPCPVGCSL